VSTQMAQAVAPRVVNADTYLALNQWAIERAAHQVGSSDGFHVSGEAVVHESAVVLPSARLLGPVLVGPRASVQSGATLVGPVSIGPGTSAGRGAVISRSVLWSGCVVGEGAFVDRCMLADGARIEPHKSVFSAVRTAGREEGSHERGARRSARTIWNPFVAAHRPAVHHHL
jgi:NDP-sugar pyrophosphorylase family protein